MTIEGPVGTLTDQEKTGLLREPEAYTLQTLHHRDACSAMFTAALFVVARKWNRPRCRQQENG